MIRKDCKNFKKDLWLAAKMFIKQNQARYQISVIIRGDNGSLSHMQLLNLGK